MKQIIVLIFITSVVAGALQGCISPLCGCSPPPSNRDFLVGRWLIEDVMLEGLDVSSDWQDFSIQFDYENYSTEFSGNTEIWPETGSYTFPFENGSGLDVIERSDSLLINIDHINNVELDFSFMESNTGGWAFSLQKVQ